MSSATFGDDTVSSSTGMPPSSASPRATGSAWSPLGLEVEGDDDRRETGRIGGAAGFQFVVESGHVVAGVEPEAVEQAER